MDKILTVSISAFLVFISISTWGQAPIISSFSPTSAKMGDAVIITGSNFTNATAVKFGGIAATSFTVNSSTQITAIVGNGKTGSVSITTTPGGIGNKTGFIFLKVPVITCVEILSGSSPMNTCITIRGKFFTGTTSVTLDIFRGQGTPTVLNDSTLDVFCFSGEGGTLLVTTPEGTSNPFYFTTRNQFFNYSFTPSIIGPDDTLTIGMYTYDFDSFSLVSDSSNISSVLTGVTGQTTGLPGFVKFLIEGNSKSQSGNFNIRCHPIGNCTNYKIATLTGLTFNATPIINSIVPSTAKAGDTIMITGKYLYTDSIMPSVMIGGVAANSVVPISNNLIKAVVGNNAASGNVTVTNSYNVTGTYAGFIYGATICPNSGTSFTSNLSGANYQWQVNDGNGFVDISNSANYSGVNTATLNLNTASSDFYGYQYRCVVDGNNSNTAVLKFANTYTGTGSTPTEQAWEMNANWSCGSVPDANTDVIINSGTIYVNINASCRSLAVKPGANVVVSSNVTLNVAH